MTLLNCDMGESYGIWRLGDDSRIMPAIHMANVACGFHASDFNHMRATVQLAKAHDVQVGAHPSLPDRQGFGRREMKIGWFPGPAGAGWVEAANKGFVDAVKGTAVQVLEPKYGDTGKEVQLKLVEDVMQANPDIKYIAGTAVTAEASIGLLRERGLTDKIGLLAFYMTPGVYEGIERGFITAAPADSMVVQGRIAINQATRLLEGKDFIKHVGPKIFVVDKSNLKTVPHDNILPPNDFKAVFKVN